MNNKYKILHVIDSLDRGGTERQMILNISTLDSNIFKNYVCCIHEPTTLAKELKSRGIDVFCLNVRGKKHWPLAVYRLAKYIKKTGINLVHTNLFQAEVIGGIAARITGVPSVTTWASPSEATNPFIIELKLNRTKLKVSNIFRRMIYRLCYREFIAVSEHVKDTWMKRTGINESRITVIPRAIGKNLQIHDSPANTNKLRSNLRVDDAYPLLLNVGRLVPQKGQKYLIEAMLTIVNKFPKVKLLIAGEGPLHNELQNYVNNLELSGSVTLLGGRDDIKMLNLACDIFVFPSLSEGMPGSLLEAAALGKPCITTDIEPVLEILEDQVSGILVPQRNPEALAQAVIKLSVNKDAAIALGLEAQKTVQARHSIESIISILSDLYTRIIQNNHK